MTAYVIYANKSCVTGRNLARYLGLPHGKSCDERYDYLLRWGSSRRVTYAPEVGPINSRRAVAANTDKLDSLRAMEDAGVSVPAFSTDPADIEWPALGRDRQHTQGTDITLILQQRDATLTDNDFYTEYIPTKLEYRVHVFDGEVIKVHEKRLRQEAENHPYIRNAETGWVFVEPRRREPDHELCVNAVEALDLDFGAVDVVRGEDDEEYVLEVNSAPSLDEANLERYGERFAELLGIDDYPGLDAPDIEFADEEDGEDA